MVNLISFISNQSVLSGHLEVPHRKVEKLFDNVFRLKLAVVVDFLFIIFSRLEFNEVSYRVGSKKLINNGFFVGLDGSHPTTNIVPTSPDVLINLLDVDIFAKDFEFFETVFYFLFVETIRIIQTIQITIFDFKLNEKSFVELDGSLRGFQSRLPHLHLRVDRTEL